MTENIWYEIFTNKIRIQKGGEALFKSNILYKDNQLIDAGKLKEFKSNWSNLSYISALGFLKDRELNIDRDTIVIVGMDFQNRDKHKTTLNTIESGMKIHAQALKTVLFLDGKLEYFNLFVGFIIIFIVFFSVSLLVRYYLNAYPEWLKFIIELSVLTTILFAISASILLFYHKWFNWFIPIVIFYVYDVIIFAREYFAQKDNNSQGEQQ